MQATAMGMLVATQPRGTVGPHSRPILGCGFTYTINSVTRFVRRHRASQFEAGRVAWTGSGGPQILDWGYGASNMTWHYLNCSIGGSPVPLGMLGMNENCTGAQGCTIQPVAMNTEWSVAWFERQDMANIGPSYWQWMFVHETGHALGLNHHIPVGSNAVMVSGQGWPNAPSSIDIGSADCGLQGIRCIYQWPW
jgi:hypothetical protein